jgi:hypothetical protein
MGDYVEDKTWKYVYIFIYNMYILCVYYVYIYYIVYINKLYIYIKQLKTLNIPYLGLSEIG